MAIAAGNVLVDAGPPRDEVPAPVVLGEGASDTDRPDSVSRGADRDGQPRVSATVKTTKVNGRDQPKAIDSPQSGDGSYAVVGGGDSPGDASGDVIRYLVEVEGGLPFDADEFAADVHRILNDKRGWASSEDAGFKRVDSGSVRFRVSLSSPDLTDEQCYPLLTRGKVSCWNGERAVINADRWGTGADTFDGDILGYREYLISHEVGHALGHAHVDCPGEGEPAPIMVQQTKSLGGCVQNSWPNP